MRKLIRGVACVIAVAVAACASGGPAGSGAPPADAPGVPPVQPDAAHTQPTPDAPPVPHDASGVLPDAAVAPDAPAGSGSGSGGQICSDNTMCPDSGTCCFIAICVPGAGLGSNLCFPSSN